MKRNAATPQGAEGLMSALNSKHDGRILDNLSGLFNGGVGNDIMTDGSKILGHVLGEKQQQVANTLGAKTGMDARSVDQILKVATPILLGVLGNQVKKQQVNNPSGLEGLLAGMLGSNMNKNEQSFLESILDADGDGHVMDDVAGMVLGGGNQKKRGIGDLLGGLFRKK